MTVLHTKIQDHWQKKNKNVNLPSLIRLHLSQGQVMVM